MASPEARRRRNRSIFRNRHAVLPVIHAEGDAQCLRNVAIARAAGADGVFLINHGIPVDDLLALHAMVVAAHPGWWIGVNCLGLAPEEIFARVGPEVAGVWVDDARIDERLAGADQPDADAIAKARGDARDRPLYFGGFAFKYQRAVDDLYRGAFIATRYMDVVTTSGPGTGAAADAAKIAQIKQGAGLHPVAIASGITPENVGDYLAHADVFLVASGISSSFTELDPARVAALVERVRAYPGGLDGTAPLVGAPAWTDDDDRVPLDWMQAALDQGPIVAARFTELTARTSIMRQSGGALVRWCSFHEIDALPLEVLLEQCGLPNGAHYRAALASSSAPIEDGWLACLHLSFDYAARRVAPEPIIRAFVARERARWRDQNVEAYLTRLYAELPDDHARVFRLIDYGYGFDLGSMDVGVGLLLDGGIWVCSRVVHSHK